ncbi:hypothetical protein CCYA_CCYA09G2504 [Cyanidiococcus yangmingshanensis]|nr:hypothetical protein CCYA_CCYA09G2504 [Cyanidiococcus yangmingshanensis]
MGGAHDHGHATFPPQPSLRQLRIAWVCGTAMWLFIFFRARADLPHMLGMHQHDHEDSHFQEKSKAIQTELAEDPESKK